VITKIDYKYQTVPYDHQHAIFMESRDEPEWAILADPGTGKSKITIDTAAWQFINGKINLLLVGAPNGVHRKWIRQEIPLHLPEYIERRCVFWNSNQTKKYLKELETIFDPNFTGLRVVTVNLEAMHTDKLKKFIRRLYNAFNVMHVIDESTRIKKPGAKRTQACINFGKNAVTKRILTGTLITQGPLDAYSQFKFLSVNILGFTSFTAYRNHYAVWRTERNWTTGRDYEVLENYRNLGELNRKIMRYSSRVRKQDCLDLPDKVYDKLVIELSAKQKKLYKQLRDDFIAEFDGKVIEATHALTRLLRLQQITGGYYDGVEIEGNTKLAAVLNYIEDVDSNIKIIIWATFKDEVRGIANALKKEYGEKSAVMYYGDVSNDDRELAVNNFQGSYIQEPCEDNNWKHIKIDVPMDEQARFFVGNPRAGGIGLDLTAATIVIYYTNDFSLETRLQSEDRAHRIGQTNKVLYIDLEAENTLDKVVVEALRNKKNLADIVVDQNPTEWI